MSAKVLGPSGHGVLSAATSWAAIISQLVCLSFPQIVPFFVQKNKDLPRYELNSVLLRWASIQALVGVVVFSLFILSNTIAVLRIGTHVQEGMLFVLLVPALLFDEYLRVIYANMQELDRYNKFALIGKTIGLVLVLMVAYGAPSNFVAFVGAYIVSGLAPASLMLFQNRKALSAQCARGVSLGFFVCHGLKLYPNTVGSLLLFNSGAVVGSLFLAQNEIGWYQFGIQIVNAISLIPQALSAVMFGEMAASTPKEVWGKQKGYAQLILMLVLVIVVIVSVIGPTLIQYFLGASWYEGGGVIISVLPLAVPIALAQVLTPQWLGRGYFNTTSLLTCGAALLSVVLNLLLLPKFGVKALVVSAWISLGVVTVIAQVWFWCYCDRADR